MVYQSICRKESKRWPTRPRALLEDLRAFLGISVPDRVCGCSTAMMWRASSRELFDDAVQTVFSEPQLDDGHE